MSKGHSTPPAPQNRTRRAAYFIKRDPEHNPHAKAEILKLAIDQHQKEEARPRKSR